MESYSIKAIAKLLQSLSPEDKQILIQELQPNDYLREHIHSFSLTASEQIDLEINQNHYRLHRLSDQDYFVLSDYTIPIKADSLFFTVCYIPMYFREEKLELAKIYLSLQYLFGETSRCFDNYKSSFAFPLFTQILKQEGTYNYVIIVQDYKGMLDFSIRRCVEKLIEPHQSFYHEPYEQEFSLEDLRYFITYFYGYLLGRLKAIRNLKPAPFYRNIPSNNILYGYCEQEGFFELEYQEDGERDQILAKFAFSYQEK